jgi:hypothetical protein
MLRLTLLALLAAAGCHHEPRPMTPKEGELPPLPPASGTPVGYLLDNASQLELRPDQVQKLKDIDESLAARNDGIDTQLREIEKPEEEDAPAKGVPPKPRNNAPGAAPIRTTSDATKLHDAHNANNRDALEKAFAVLDPTQQTAAKKLLDERGISSPGAAKQPPPNTDAAAGVPLEP